MSLDNNPVNPSHYQKGNGIETIDYLEAVCMLLPGDEAVSVSNIIKYVSRYREKHPKDPTRDLRKARWYLDRLIKLVEAATAPVLPMEPTAEEFARKMNEAKPVLPLSPGWLNESIANSVGRVDAMVPSPYEKNRKEDEESLNLLFRTNTQREGVSPDPRRCPDCGVGEGYLHADNCVALDNVNIHPALRGKPGMQRPTWK